MKGLGGTGSQGLRSRGKSHIPCRRCGRCSYHATKKACASCGFGNGPKMRGYAWKNSRKRSKL
ncbi:50S ribosomal protein L37e [Candidatus Woesearchaeota archaeon]|nr:50S ribosomal protein L37e [Candidatus Woesearchaeota archaeon]